MVPINDLSHYLEHQWYFNRRVIHHKTDQLVCIEGAAGWRELEAGVGRSLLYEELGVVKMASYTGNATQRYSYDLRCAGVADVHFRDGRFFYRLDLTTGCCDIEHLCRDDTYRGVFDVVSETLFRQSWQVSGPRKNFSSHTDFFRY